MAKRRKKSLMDIHNQYMRIFRNGSVHRAIQAESIYHRYALNIKGKKSLQKDMQAFNEAYKNGNKEEMQKYADKIDNKKFSYRTRA